MHPPFRNSRCSTTRPIALAALVLVAGVADVACRGAVPADRDATPPPAAEFVLSAGDSAFWVTSLDGTIRVRGAPLELARVGGRFYELYVADDDRSFGDATFIGQRVYRRDLLRGDSALVYEDTLVPALARDYARLHPGDRRLGADDEPSVDPLWSVTSTLDVVDVHGPFVSFDAHTDVERAEHPPWHTSRRGVIDLRGRGAVALAQVVGGGAPLLQVERARSARLAAALDSVRVERRQGSGAAVARPAYQLDPTSFTLTTVDGGPAVAYALSGSGSGSAGHLFPLAPIRFAEPSWWPEVAATLPVGSANGGRDVWRHGGYDVVVHYDSSVEAGRLTLRDRTSREWTIGHVPAPATRIFWLDAPAIDSAGRRALARAFEESSLYDEAVRTAAFTPRTPRPRRRAATARLRHRAHPAAAPRLAPHA
jgi:hypothetical protein